MGCVCLNPRSEQSPAMDADSHFGSSLTVTGWWWWRRRLGPDSGLAGVEEAGAMPKKDACNCAGLRQRMPAATLGLSAVNIGSHTWPAPCENWQPHQACLWQTPATVPSHSGGRYQQLVWSQWRTLAAAPGSATAQKDAGLNSWERGGGGWRLGNGEGESSFSRRQWWRDSPP